MYECDICGKQVSKIFVVNIEGATMNACESCAKGKEAIQVLDSSKQKAPSYKSAKPEQEEIDVVIGYGSIIRGAREQMGLPLKVLAERINEKESTLFRVENEKMLPNDVIVKKLEKELSIKLTEVSKKSKNVHGGGKNQPLTLGDYLIKKKDE